MPRFFPDRPPLQLVGDVAVAGLGGAKNGVLAGLGLSAAGGTLAVGSMGAIVGACALGAAIGIIPAMMLHQMLFGPKYSPAHMLQFATNGIFRAAFTFSTACMGAAILGLAVMPIAVAAMSASFALSLLTLVSSALIKLTAPEHQHGHNNTFLSMRIA